MDQSIENQKSGKEEMDELTSFADWFLKNSPVIAGVPLFGAVSKIEDVTGVLMYRSPPFQVQMFIVPPNYIIPEHTHPNVDSYEVYMGGQLRLALDGKFLLSEEDMNEPDPDGSPKMAGKLIRVRPHELHGSVSGPSGGVFLSIQHWLNGIDPHCVAADYTGPVMGAHHFAQVKSGIPILKESLSVKDAAGLE